ncbi:hypothetical protein PBY51_008303 [Eleginops maclovinus]|uniref:Uncharacterized protein n=1 Tax=Eleginops maclovinus TaxID=56733 RepID=A0AAN7X818_ELEMC|nr:hypothetical protein PBY51_008303 [Eleginops maclovinus]
MPWFCPLPPSLYVLGVIDPSHQLALISFTPKRSWFVGRRPIMEAIQKLFKLQISLSFSAASQSAPPCLACPYSVHPPPLLFILSSLCHWYLSYPPGGRANRIRGTCLTNALPLSVSPCPSHLWSYSPLSPERSISVPWSFPLPCWSPCRRWSSARL